MGIPQTFDWAIALRSWGHYVGLYLHARSRSTSRIICRRSGARHYSYSNFFNRRETQLLPWQDVHEEWWRDGMCNILQRLKVWMLRNRVWSICRCWRQWYESNLCHRNFQGQRKWKKIKNSDNSSQGKSWIWVDKRDASKAIVTRDAKPRQRYHNWRFQWCTRFWSHLSNEES